MKSPEYFKIDDTIYIQKKKVRGRVYESAPHYHNAFETHYFIKGEINFFVYDQTYKVKKGDIIFIDTYEMHNPFYDVGYDFEKYLLTYRPSFTQLNAGFKAPDIFSTLDRKFNGQRLVSVPPYLQEKLEFILDEMLEISGSRSEYAMTYLHSYLLLFLTYIADFLDSTDSINDQPAPLNLKIRNIITYINDNLDKDLSLDVISGFININKFHLCRLFKESTGLSVKDYINRNRIIYSEKLISINKQSITDIAHMTGFNSLTHFERTFRQITGISPRDYKKNHGIVYPRKK